MRDYINSMNILFDLGHPAHIHLFRNFIYYLKKNNYNVIITSRNKDINYQLLDYYKIEYLPLSNARKTRFGLIFELLIRDIKIFFLYRKYRFKYSFGTSVSIAHLSLFTKVLSFNFCEDDDDIIPLQAKLIYPFTTKIIIPESLRYKKWNNKRIFHNSYHELAYLHPNNFKPDKSILKKYNLEPFEYVMIRFSALKAHHDAGESGISDKIWEKIYNKINNFPLIISRENVKSHQIDPWDIHHIIAFSKIIISDSQTMTIEAAVLGTPSIRYNSFVGRISVLEELEKKYNLTYGFKPGQETDLLLKIDELLKIKTLKEEWLKKKKKLLIEKTDFNMWLIDYFENIEKNKL